MTIEDLRDKMQEKRQLGEGGDMIRATLQDDGTTIESAEIFEGRKQIYAYPDGYRSYLFQGKHPEDVVRIRGNWKHERSANEQDQWRLTPLGQPLVFYPI